MLDLGWMEWNAHLAGYGGMIGGAPVRSSASHRRQPGRTGAAGRPLTLYATTGGTPAICNPSHLFILAARDNNADMVAWSTCRTRWAAAGCRKQARNDRRQRRLRMMPAHISDGRACRPRAIDMAHRVDRRWVGWAQPAVAAALGSRIGAAQRVLAGRLPGSVVMGNDGHQTPTVGAGMLHPTEALLVSMATARGAWVRTCTCGLIVTGNNEVDVYGPLPGSTATPSMNVATDGAGMARAPLPHRRPDASRAASSGRRGRPNGGTRGAVRRFCGGTLCARSRFWGRGPSTTPTWLVNAATRCRRR